jgi:hypothetical protein
VPSDPHKYLPVLVAAIPGPTGASSPIGIMNTRASSLSFIASDTGNGGEAAYADVIDDRGPRERENRPARRSWPAHDSRN